MSIFPFFENVETPNQDIQMYSEVAWNFERNIPVVENGDFKIVKGIEAIKSWIFRSIQVPRYKNEIYSWNYGNELETLIGKQFNALSKAEAERYVKEALLVNPYITSINNINIYFYEAKIVIECTIDTVYGLTKEVFNV